MAHNRSKILLCFGAIYFIWGSTYLALKYALEDFPPFLLGALRFLIAGAILYIWAEVRTPEKTTIKQWRSALIIGFLLPFIGFGSVNWAMQVVPSGLAAVLVATEPFWIVLMTWLGPDRKKPGGKTIAGVILGFIGIFMIFGFGDFANISPEQVPSSFIIILATVSWAAGSLYSRNAIQPNSPILSASMQFLVGGTMFLVTSFFLGELRSFDYTGVSWDAWGAMAYLAIFGSVVAYTAYIWLLKVVPAEKVSTYAYVNPIIAVFLGWSLADEVLTLQTIAATLVIVVGVVMITSLKNHKKNVVQEGIELIHE